MTILQDLYASKNTPVRPVYLEFELDAHNISKKHALLLTLKAHEYDFFDIVYFISKFQDNSCVFFSIQAVDKDTRSGV